MSLTSSSDLLTELFKLNSLTPNHFFENSSDTQSREYLLNLMINGPWINHES